MPDATAAELLTDAEHARRLALRDGRGRARVLCVRCRRKIPAGKRADAIYCSDGCKSRYRWEQHDALKLEVGRMRRALLAPKVCPHCGDEIDQSAKLGRWPSAHRKCYHRAKQAEYRERKRRAAVPAEGDLDG